MSKSKILIQLDPDPQPSVFDSIVAIDAGVDHLISHGNITPDNTTGLVHGAMFTRGPEDLRHTALFFGGSNVEATEKIVEQASSCFFGPMRVSYLSDPNGSNTTAAAAVICAEKHLALAGQTITILAGTGPVGLRIAQIIATTVGGESSTSIRVCSRQLGKAKKACEYLESICESSDLFLPVETDSPESAMDSVKGSGVVFAAGAAGVQLLPKLWTSFRPAPAVMIDLNAVPPSGIAGVGVTDKAVQKQQTICYGAIGVGGLKMKIHKRCIASLFESNDRALDTLEVYEIGRSV